MMIYKNKKEVKYLSNDEIFRELKEHYILDTDDVDRYDELISELRSRIDMLWRK